MVTPLPGGDVHHQPGFNRVLSIDIHARQFPRQLDCQAARLSGDIQIVARRGQPGINENRGCLQVGVRGETRAGDWKVVTRQ